jgi:succinyl-diaminopimelate desuccinylase
MSCSVIDPIKLTQELVYRASVTPLDEGAQDVILDALTILGFKHEDVTTNGIRNSFARLGSKGPHLSFNGHTDVVPAGNESLWKYPPFSATIDGDILYGRGTADMKANIACFIAAVSRYIEKNGAPNGTISFMITGDEEADAIDGTIRILEHLQRTNQLPDHCIVGEATNPDEIGQEIKIGRRGSYTGYLKVRGKQGHTAYPHRADNPLPRLVKMLDALSDYQFDKGNEFFQPSNLQISSIDVGNKASNVIPAEGSAVFSLRFNNEWTLSSLSAKIKEILDQFGTDYELTYKCNAEAFLTQPNQYTEMMRQAVETITGKKPEMTTSGGSSDAKFVSKFCSVAEFGLVNDTIHKTDEHTKLSDIETLTKCYEEMIRLFFANT